MTSRTMRLPRRFPYRVLLLLLILITATSTVTAAGVWDWWHDLVNGGDGASFDNADDKRNARIWSNTLSTQEIGEMRVRDIKRRLQRAHGYSAEEVARMLDKQELIHALGMEEHKVREQRAAKQQRALTWRSVMAAVLSVSVVLFWPVLSHVWEVAAVNVVVYTDRKRFEMRRCRELGSFLGLMGVISMLIMDALSLWLSASILLSWFVKSKYFFPMPSLAIHPAKFMGGEVANGPMANYGFNIAPMLVSWGLRFGNSQIEKWTGKALASAQRELKRQARDNETLEAKEERRARRAARKAAKEAAEAQEAAAAAATKATPTSAYARTNQHQQSSPMFEPADKAPPEYDTSPASVQAFLGDEFEKATSEHVDDEPAGVQATSGLDELD